MTDYIGARLSLVSKSDIRYVGILHEIDSANSTVSLEQVRSFGTEGRKGDPALEIPASDNVFEYIIFRGSDVKDLRVEQSAGQTASAPKEQPQDPAIVQSAPVPQQQQQQAPPQHQHQHQHPQHPQHNSQGPPRGFDGPGYPMPPQQGYGYGYPPPQQHFAPQGYGYPPPHQGQHAPYQPVQPQPDFPQQGQSLFAPQPQNAFPELPGDSKPQAQAPAQAKKTAPLKTDGDKATQAKIVPALPLPGHAASPKPKTTNKDISGVTAGVANLSTSTPAESQVPNGQASAPKRNALLEVQRNMKTSTPSAQPKTDTSAVSKAADVSQATPAVTSAPASRGGRRSPNATRRDPGVRQNGVIVNPNASIVIPKDEYDFTSANAKFSREGLESEVTAAPVYNKQSSFFDSISSEATDRNSAGNASGRGRGREIRNQERTMNYETFGEDLAFRNNRGRGRGGRGRGRGRGRGAAEPVSQ